MAKRYHVCFCLPLWYLLAIVLSVLQFTVSGYPYGIFWPLYYLSFNLWFLVTPMVSFGHCIICPSIYGFWLPLWYLLAIVLSVLQFTVSGYPYGIFWPLYYLSFNIRKYIEGQIIQWPKDPIGVTRNHKLKDR
jgi:hypothetical protein